MQQPLASGPDAPASAPPLFWVGVTALVAARALMGALGQQDANKMLFIAVAAGFAIHHYCAAHLSQQREQQQQQQHHHHHHGEIEGGRGGAEGGATWLPPGSGRVPRAVDAALYTLRRTDAHKSARALQRGPLPPHVSRRPQLACALRDLARSHARRNRGTLARVIALLEDFFTRYEAALLCSTPDAPRLVARTLPVLMDTRSEALNSLQVLMLSRPLLVSKDTVHAQDVIRSETLACASRLGRRFPNAPDVQVAVNACVQGPRAVGAGQLLPCLLY